MGYQSMSYQSIGEQAIGATLDNGELDQGAGAGRPYEVERVARTIECAKRRGGLIRETILNGVGGPGGKQESQDKRRTMKRIPQSGKQIRNVDKQTTAERS